MASYLIIIFSAGLFLIVIKIGQQIIASWRHVEEETLTDFWNGRLQKKDDKEYRRVVNHLGSCQACRDRLDEITQQNKTRYGIDDQLISRRF
jgi:hypothetical protein